MTAGNGVQPADLGFFATLSGAGSLSAAGRELGITTPAVSRHLAQMESRVGVALVNRTTRRMSLTPEGELYLEHARRILAEIGDMEELLGVANPTPRGLLRINATPGFGRRHVAPLISDFVRMHPHVEVRLELSANAPALVDDAFDVCIRFGAPSDGRAIARRIAPNRRLLCASPAYLAEHGVPNVPDELARHRCIDIRQAAEGCNVWRVTSGSGRHATHALKVTGNLTTNDSDIAVDWALDGHGILMAVEWDIERHLASGRLVQVLARYDMPDADVHAVYPQRHRLAPRIRTFVDFAAASFAGQARTGRSSSPTDRRPGCLPSREGGRHESLRPIVNLPSTQC